MAKTDIKTELKDAMTHISEATKILNEGSMQFIDDAEFYLAVQGNILTLASVNVSIARRLDSIKHAEAVKA